MSEKNRKKNIKCAILLIIFGIFCIGAECEEIAALLWIIAIAILFLNRKKNRIEKKKTEPEFQISIEIQPDPNYKSELAQKRMKNVNNVAMTFEQQKKSTFPSKNGLYIPEILLIEYCKYGSYPMESQKYPGFWWNRYGVHDVNLLLASLEKRGFITSSSASGKYNPTPLGLHEVEENGYVVYFHRSMLSEISVLRMNELVHNNPFDTWNTLLWKELASVKQQYFNENMYGLYRCTCLQQYFFAMNENAKEDAFRFLAETMYLDLNEKAISLNEDELERCVAPGLVKYLSDLRNRFGYDESTLIKNLMCVFDVIDNKRSYLSDLQTAEIIAAYVFGHPDTIKERKP